jgi:CheY-like chemotaxis protein
LYYCFNEPTVDIQMPVMGGMEATKLIMERDPDAIIIFVTAHALDEFKAQADAVGATSFISKPFRLDDIQKVLIELGF